MALKISADYRQKLKNGEEFSSQDGGFIVVENTELAKKGETQSPLQLKLHSRFILDMLHNNHDACFWLVENPNKTFLEALQQAFPDHNILNGSIMGYCHMDESHLSKFWSIFELADKEPWKNEAAWAIGSVSERLLVPKPSSILQRSFWSVDYVLQNWRNLNCIFSQAGWFTFCAIKCVEGVEEQLKKEFPNALRRP